MSLCWFFLIVVFPAVSIFDWFVRLQLFAFSSEGKQANFQSSFRWTLNQCCFAVGLSTATVKCILALIGFDCFWGRTIPHGSSWFFLVSFWSSPQRGHPQCGGTTFLSCVLILHAEVWPSSKVNSRSPNSCLSHASYSTFQEGKMTLSRNHHLEAILSTVSAKDEGNSHTLHLRAGDHKAEATHQMYLCHNYIAWHPLVKCCRGSFCLGFLIFPGIAGGREILLLYCFWQPNIPPSWV